MQPQGDLSNLRPSLLGFLPFCCMIGWINGRSWWIPSILLHVCLSSSVQCWTDQSINQNVGWDLDILMAHIPPSSWFLTTLIALYPVLLGRSEKVKLTELWISEWRRYLHKVSFPMLNWLKYRYRHLSGIEWHYCIYASPLQNFFPTARVFHPLLHRSEELTAGVDQDSDKWPIHSPRFLYQHLSLFPLLFSGWMDHRSWLRYKISEWRGYPLLQGFFPTSLFQCSFLFPPSSFPLLYRRSEEFITEV